MKTIGMIGGMSWESTVTYYRIINTVVKEKMGGLHSAKCVLYSVDFQEIERCQASGDWAGGAAILADAAVRLEKFGADFLLICTNTMHKVADEIQGELAIPILHIAEATAVELKAAGVSRVGLLGTKYTMEQDFYRSKLTASGLDVVVPEAADREEVNRVIYDELCLGRVEETSKRAFLNIAGKLARAGTQGVVLGCTEIGLLIQQADMATPLFDTTLIHARQAALRAVAEDTGVWPAAI